jgi:hypothetical protein
MQVVDNAASFAKPRAARLADNMRRFILTATLGQPTGRNVTLILTPLRMAFGYDISLILDGCRLYLGPLTIQIAWRPLDDFVGGAK